MALRIGLGLGLSGGVSFSPLSLFAASEPGFWYDPSDLSTLFQDTAGTTPVTAAGQSVGLALDKSQGLVLGPELWANQVATISNSAGGAIYTYTSTTQELNVTTAGTDPGYPRLRYDLGLVAGKMYRVEGRIDGVRSGVAVIRLSLSGSANILTYNSTTGVFSGYAFAAGTLLEIAHNGTISGSRTLATISVRELPGNHATQSTSLSRPTLGRNPVGGTRNLLTFTEEFDNAGWSKLNATVTANATTSPDGTVDADFVVADTTNAQHGVYQAATAVSGTTYTHSVYAKAGGYNWLYMTEGNNVTAQAWFNLATGALGTVSGTGSPSATITPVGNGWYRCTLTLTPISTLQNFQCRAANANGGGSFTGDGTSGIYVWGAQLETGSTATAYQKVVSSFNVTEAGKADCWYLGFDGSDDFLITPTITPGTDKVQVFAGVRKLSDAARGIVFELGNDAVNSLQLNAPQSGVANYSFGSRGAASLSSAVSPTTYAAPITNVLTGIGDIAADTAILRVNGAQAASSPNDQGTGNYGNYPAYIGRRGGTSLPFNGRLYSLICRFGSNLTADQIAQTEAWVNSKTGAY